MMCWRLFRYPLCDKARDGANTSGGGSGTGAGAGSGSSGTGSGSGSTSGGSNSGGTSGGVITGQQVGNQTNNDKNIDDTADAYAGDINKIFSGSGNNNAATSTLDRISTTKDNKNFFSDCILRESFDATELGDNNQDKPTSSQEIIDVLTQYTWTIDDYKSSSNTTAAYLNSPIPCCYLAEYQQKTGSNILNLINTMVAGISTTKDLASTVSGLINSGNSTADAANGERGLTRMSKSLQSLRQALVGTANEDNSNPDDPASQAASQRQQGAMVNSVLSKGAKMINKVTEVVGNGIDSITNPCIRQDNGLNFLAPYSLLYSLKPTEKKFCFPMITNPPVLGVSQNDWGEASGGTSIVSTNSFITGLTTLAENAISAARDIQDMVNFFQGGSNAYMATGVQKAMFYNYPKNTEEYTVTFPLINNTKKSEWKKNYKFILMFCLRNMPFRKDNSSFYPPVLYDLTIPGVIRQPYCYVNSISVRPMGLTKMIQGRIGFKNIIEGGNIQVNVAVPEAWVVTIKIKSLLATTGNLILSQLLQNDSIVTNVNQASS